jgi:hypothetical protein
MADYTNSCPCGKTVHEPWCRAHHNYKNWKIANDKAEAFKEIAQAAEFDVKEDWLVCNFCFCLVQKALIAIRTHRRGCANPYRAAERGLCSDDIKEMIRNG